MGEISGMSIIEQMFIALVVVTIIIFITNFIFNIIVINHNNAMLKTTKQMYEFNKKCREKDSEGVEQIKELNKQTLLANLHYLNKLNGKEKFEI
jgi:ABC-type transport system involved in multi-copper enzyme maturation permease subunit